jgi:hypothetical protein
MTKSLRFRLVGIFLILAATLTVSGSAVPTPWPPLPGDLWVYWVKTPPSKVCLKTELTVAAQYFRGEKFRVFAPLVPFYPNDKDYPTDAGKLEVSAELGSFDKSETKVRNNGMVYFIYTPLRAGKETLTAKLTYPTLESAITRHFFTVEDCRQVLLKIDASIIKLDGADFTTVKIKGEGWLTYLNGTVTGDVDLKGEFTKMPSNDAAKCKVIKGTEGTGKVHVEGKLEDSILPAVLGGGKKIVLKLKYEKITGFNQDGKTVCKDRVTGKITREIPIKGLEEMDPAKYLKEELVYPEGRTDDKGTFGGQGKALYEFFFGW